MRARGDGHNHFLGQSSTPFRGGRLVLVKHRDHNHHMVEFPSWQSYAMFAHSVKRKARYFRDPDVEDFLRTVFATGESRKRTLLKGRILWRAQLGHGWRTDKHDGDEFDVLDPHSPKRMRPLLHSATEGRVNPRGIPYLYLATDKDTAMSEVRPWLGKYISVAQFNTVKDLVLIDCSVAHSEGFTFYFEEPKPAEREKAVWRDIDRSFSEPVNSDESTADYVPTQVLAEYFRRNGLDGVVYKSLLGKGFNIALFDINAAELINCSLYTAKRVSLEFDEVAGPYFIRKHYPGLQKENV